MRFIVFLSILIMSALCSCRSSRQVNTDYADTTSVAVEKVSDSLESSDILSVLSASRELNLSDVRVEFYPPDSVHPDSRAAPRSLTIGGARSRSQAEQTTHESADMAAKETVNLSAQSSSASQQVARSENDFIRPADRVIIFSLLGAILISTIALIISTKSKK